jgi:hypothetical protein
MDLNTALLIGAIVVIALLIVVVIVMAQRGNSGNVGSFRAHNVSDSHVIQEVGSRNRDNRPAIDQGFHFNYEEISNKPGGNKHEVIEAVKQIETEANQGGASKSAVTQQFEFLKKMAPDVLKVVAAALVSPASGVSEAIKLIAAEYDKEVQST